jgi:hypothetical protein
MIQRLTIALAALALMGGGCGGSNETAPRQPSLPPALADELATRSDRVAQTLARGDRCGADAQADELRAAATAASDSGRVPRPLRRELLEAVTSLAGQIECPRPEPAPAQAEEDKDEDEDEGEGKKGKGKGKGKDKHDEEEDD